MAVGVGSGKLFVYTAKKAPPDVLDYTTHEGFPVTYRVTGRFTPN